MNDESDKRLIAHYRSVAREEPSASLDRAILALARRRAVRVRTLRRSVVFCAVLVGAVALVTLPQHPRMTRVTPIPDRTGYGLHEGATREYLLTVSPIPPGAIDWR
jgi:hypothetical protein